MSETNARTVDTRRQLPPDWRWVRLGEVLRLAGNVLDPQIYPEETFAHYSIPAFDAGQKPTAELGAAILSSKLLFPAGVVLFSKLNPRIARVWYVDDDCTLRRICSTEFLPLLPDTAQLDPRYLSLALRDPRSIGAMRAQVAAATKSRERLRPDTVLASPIPLPPLPEQKRIAALLNEQMAAVERARAAAQAQLGEAKALPAAYLRQVFPGPDQELPAGWRWVRLGDVCEFRHGGTPSKSVPEFWNGTVPWASPKDMKALVLEDTEDHVAQSAVTAGSTGFAPASAILTVVRSGILSRHVPFALTARPMAFNQDIKAIIPDATRVDVTFLVLVLRSREPTILANGVKKGPTVHSFKSGYLEGISVPLPRLTEQRGLAARLNAQMVAAEKLRADLKSQLDEINALPAALLRRAFNGEL